MGKKKKVSPAVAAPAGCPPVACERSDEGPFRDLKFLNSRLVKETAEYREQINQLRSELNAMKADHIIAESIERDVFGVFLSSHVSVEIRRANARLKAERAAVTGMIGNLVKKDGLSGENSKKLVYLEERLRFMEQKREVSEAESRKLEEEKMENLLQSSMNEKVLLESFFEKKKDLAEKFERVMEEMKSRKESAEIRANASKEINDRLKSEVCGLKICLEDQKKKNSAFFEGAQKEKLRLEKALVIKEKEMALQINEFKENVTKLAEEKELLKQRTAEDEIQIIGLQREISKLQSDKKILVDENASWSKRSSNKEGVCTALKRELNLKESEAAGLKSQQEDLIKDKYRLVQKCKELRVNISDLTIENENMKISLNEKASLEKQLKISQKGLQDAEKKLMDIENAYVSILHLLTTTTEVEEQIGEDDVGIHYLDTIKHAINSKDETIQDMSQKLELMKLQKKKGGVWKWLLPSATITIGAVTLGYLQYQKKDH